MAALGEGAITLMLGSLSQSSKNLYIQVLSKLGQFAASTLNRDKWFPTSSWIVSLYVSYMTEKGYAPSTVASHVSVIAFFHKLLGLSDPTEQFFVKRMLLGAKKLYRTYDSRVPISLDVLKKLVDSTDFVCKSDYESALFKSMYILMFHGFMRIGEVTDSPNNIMFSNVHWSTKFISVTFQKFKHHSGFPIIISIPRSGNSFCPVLLTLSYLTRRGPDPGPLFSFPGGIPVQPRYFNIVLGNSLAWAGLSKLNIKPHSFRIGAATWAAANGYSDNQIQIMGRWKSAAFRKYIRVQMFTVPS